MEKTTQVTFRLSAAETQNILLDYIRKKTGIHYDNESILEMSVVDCQKDCFGIVVRMIPKND